jgi:hypothetical protein
MQDYGSVSILISNSLSSIEHSSTTWRHIEKIRPVLESWDSFEQITYWKFFSKVKNKKFSTQWKFDARSIVLYALLLFCRPNSV